MKKRVTAIVLALSLITASLSGCAGNTESPSTPQSNSSSSQTSSSESKPDSSSGNQSSSVSSEPEKTADMSDITFAATDEIKNAGFGSGLVQWYNDVFQCGGYVSVPEFIEKYKSSYEFNYNKAPLDEAALSTPVDPSIREKGNLKHLSLHGTPKFTINGKQTETYLIVEVMNPKDQPIPLSECYVDYVWISKYAYGVRAGGFIADDGVLGDLVDVSAPEYLKSLGYEEMKRPTGIDGYALKASMEYNKKFFKDSNDNYWFYDVGEPNAFGARPFYRNDIGFNGRVNVPNNVGYIFE